MDPIVAYATSNKVNLEKVLQIVVVDESRNSYNNGNVIFLYFMMGVLVYCRLIQGQCLSHSMQIICL